MFPCSGGTWTWIQFCPPSGSKLLTTFLYVPLEPRNSSIISPAHTLDLGPRMYLEPSDYVGTRVDLGRLWPPLMDIIGRRRDGEKLFPNFNWLSEWHQPSANTGPRMGTSSHIPGLFFEQLGKQTHFCWHVMMWALGGSLPWDSSTYHFSSRENRVKLEMRGRHLSQEINAAWSQIFPLGRF